MIKKNRTEIIALHQSLLGTLIGKLCIYTIRLSITRQKVQITVSICKGTEFHHKTV